MSDEVVEKVQTAEREYCEFKDRFLKRNLNPSEYKWSPFRKQFHIPYGNKERLENDAACLRFIKENTNIPVPKVHDAYEKIGAEGPTGSFYLWLELVPGVAMSQLKIDEQAIVMKEVEEHLHILHSLRSNQLGGPTGLLCPPPRVKRDDPWGPDMKWTPLSTSTDDYVFCHNDLSQTNIMVDPKTLKITGIIDWEFGGFFPEYFEVPFFRDNRTSGTQMLELKDAERLIQFLKVLQAPLKCILSR